MKEIKKEIKACPICGDTDQTGILRDWQDNVLIFQSDLYHHK